MIKRVLKEKDLLILLNLAYFAIYLHIYMFLK